MTYYYNNTNDLQNRFMAKSILVDSGNLFVCGYNGQGQLGLNDTTTRYSPTQLVSGSNWKQVAANFSAYSTNYHTAGIKTNGTLWMWGNNSYGQLGLSNTTNRSTPVQVGSDSNWSKVYCGNQYTIAIKTDGTLWAWGYNGNGQLALGDLTIRYSPVQVGTLSDWSDVSCGLQHTMFIKTDGTLWACGNNNEGQLFNNNLTSYSSPVQISTDSWTKVSVALSTTFAINSNGTLWVAGSTYGVGLLGLNTSSSNAYSPTQIGTLSNWSKISSSYYHATAIKTDGTIWSWGKNDYGQLGLSDNVNRSSPTQIGTVSNWSKVSCGGSQHTMALKTDGTLWGWGRNNVGQLALSYSSESSYGPIRSGTMTTWSQISCGYQSTFITQII